MSLGGGSTLLATIQACFLSPTQKLWSTLLRAARGGLLLKLEGEVLEGSALMVFYWVFSDGSGSPTSTKGTGSSISSTTTFSSSTCSRELLQLREAPLPSIGTMNSPILIIHHFVGGYVHFDRTTPRPCNVTHDQSPQRCLLSLRFHYLCNKSIVHSVCCKVYLEENVTTKGGRYVSVSMLVSPSPRCVRVG